MQIQRAENEVTFMAKLDVALNEIGVLTRREIEARILAPIVDAMSQEFGRERVLQIVRKTITEIATQQGRELVQIQGGSTMNHFASALPNWTKDDALTIEVLAQEKDELRFNVTRCRYAEMYAELGLQELGEVLSCNRDASLIRGFNPETKFSRSQTILGGASHCDFHFSNRT
jgi:hypothetical protein